MAKPTFNNCLCLALLVCGFDVVAAQELRKPATYDFRDSDQYRALDETSRSRLETVVEDLARLERAINSFMNDHCAAETSTCHIASSGVGFRYRFYA